MKFPSIQYLSSSAINSFRRFPMVLISALTAVIIGIFLVENNKMPSAAMVGYLNIILTGAIGIPLFFCAQMIREKLKAGQINIILTYGIAVLLLLLIYISLPTSEFTFNTSQPYIRYVSYNLCAHLLISFLPYIQTKGFTGFWQYNKLLFLRLVISGIYSSFLFSGLTSALGAINLLFDVEVRGETFFEIFIVIAGIFNTWFFLSGIPEDFKALEQDNSYPKGLKIFSQYILLPLLSLYLLILYAYAAKIMISRNWPEGIVSYLIIYIAVLGIFTCLLLHPYANSKENKWISRMNKAFYLLLGPLLFLLFYAILVRMGDYGITINRYMVLALGIWLAAVCIYTYFKGNNIKFIPASLAIVIFLTSWGPWGMYSVSEQSQLKRLETIFTESGILKEGKLQHENKLKEGMMSFPPSVNLDYSNDKLLTDSLHNEVLSIMDYLNEHHGFSGIKQWYSQDIDSFNRREVIMSKASGKYFEKKKAFLLATGIEDNYFDQTTEGNKSTDEYAFINADHNTTLTETKGYDYIIDFDANTEDLKKDETIADFELKDKKGYIKFKNSQRLGIEFDMQSAEIDLRSISSTYQSDSAVGTPEISLPQDSLALLGRLGNYEFRIQFDFLKFNLDSNKNSGLQRLRGSLFLRRR
jgi:hypothetical protein